jgi:predicted transporter
VIVGGWWVFGLKMGMGMGISGVKTGLFLRMRAETGLAGEGIAVFEVEMEVVGDGVGERGHKWADLGNDL